MEDRNYEQEAKEDGWAPKEEWRGPDEQWIDAKSFVEKGEKISGILKSKIGRLENDVESLRHTNAEFKKFTDAQIAKERKKSQQLIEELEQVKATAITEGDGAAAVKAEREINDLRNSEQPNVDVHNQMAQAWAAQNAWYGTNQKLGAFADGIAERIVQEGYTGQAYFNELTRRTKETFPEEFENPNRSKANGVETGGDKEVKDSKARKWDNLPQDAKAEAARFIKDIPGFTKESYLANYEWE